jgi:diaminohydroxyphosphoribosylaminopyrimidine deaminase/5-amino-6-(5-phosphoribosylamino)uracil reductase
MPEVIPADASHPQAEIWMNRALELARQGEALASPNPMVGAVVVQEAAHGGRVVGEGFHTYAGLRHAEIVALQAAGAAARGSTLYVNLEPCCHLGRTGPCTAAIIAAGVRRVVVAITDPNPAVAGRGIEQLRAAGLQVEIGLGKIEGQKLNEAFCKWISTRRPLLTLKSALTLDGQIALPTPRRQRPRQKTVTWITSEESRSEVQRLRHAADALLTGIGTVLADDPRLTDRTGRPRRRRLLRVVMDSRLRLPLKSKLVKSAEGDVLVFTTQPADSPRARALRRAGVEVARVRSRDTRPDLRAMVEELGRREILSVLLEAGGELNAAALAAGVVDKMFLFYAPRMAGSNHRGVVQTQGRAFRALPALKNLSLHRFGPDFAVEGYLRDVYRNH